MKTNSYRESLQTVLAHARPLAAEEISFHHALGRVLAADVLVEADDPPVPKSAMDGFALKSVDTAGAAPGGPRRFSYSEVVGAGHLAAEKVTSGRAVRLMTGAWLPEGADAVVKQEDTRPLEEESFELFRPLEAGENVIAKGARLRRGDVALPGGVPIGPAALAMLAGQGKSRLSAVRRPRVALLALGDELVEVGEPLAPGKLYVSNIYALEAKVRRYGGEPRRLGIAADDPELMLGLLRPTLLSDAEDPNPLGCEMVITVGGSHGGEFDFAQQVLQRLGAELHFRRTALNLGNSTLFATFGGTLLFGLAGTPLPSLVGFELLARPALWRLCGRTELNHPLVEARLTGALAATTGRACFQPGRLTFKPGGMAEVTPLRDKRASGRENALMANALIRVPEGAELLQAGETVTAEWLGD